jgi:uncharacterized protein (DUF305 family)|tara:strand:+ start:438 stop:1028 length:591 start_codon:yes stop_codon:yes gene_type:complete
MPQVLTRKLALRFLVLATVLSVTGCAAMPASMTNQGDTQVESASGVNTSDFSGADIMFAQMMIPHHQQAIDMSALAESRALSPEVRALALKISAEQGPEIEQMRSWLKAANAPTEMGHQMSMDGMLSEAELERLTNARGEEFDELFILGMIAHHEGAIEMAQMVVDSKNLEARELGTIIVKIQTLEIAELRALLSN